MYLDNAATTKCSVNQLHDLIDEINDKNLWYNPSSSYADNVRSEIEDVRRRIAESLDCLPEERIYEKIHAKALEISTPSSPKQEVPSTEVQ